MASLGYFGGPALLFVAGFHWLMPLLIGGGMLPFYAYSLSLGLPLVRVMARYPTTGLQITRRGNARSR